jgi:hypothetical protein
VVAVGLLLFAWAFLWMRYSDRLQILGLALMQKVSGRPLIENDWFFGLVRWFGTIFLAVMGVLCVISGSVGLITGR